jgi:hypothetical protein
VNVDPNEVGSVLERLVGRRSARWYWIAIVAAMALNPPFRNYVFHVWESNGLALGKQLVTAIVPSPVPVPTPVAVGTQ